MNEFQSFRAKDTAMLASLGGGLKISAEEVHSLLSWASRLSPAVDSPTDRYYLRYISLFWSNYLSELGQRFPDVVIHDAKIIARPATPVGSHSRTTVTGGTCIGGKIDPRNPDDFAAVFAGATKIMAYDPPLDLLLDHDDDRYRHIITTVLGQMSPAGKYLLICGHEVAPRAVQMYNAWVSGVKGNAKKKLNLLLSKMVVVYCDFPGGTDLHATLELGGMGSVPCGNSYFLVENHDRDTLLLYVMGAGLSNSFTVPSIALKYVAPRGSNALFTALRLSFGQCWEKFRKPFKPMGLPEFAKNWTGPKNGQEMDSTTPSLRLADFQQNDKSKRHAI